MTRTTRIRAFACCATILAGSAHVGNAQIATASGLSPFAKDYKVDFAIPDSPAFKLLQVEESAILRPQTVRDLSLAFQGFTGNSFAFVIPKQLGIEVSPGLLIDGSKLRLQDYQARRFLYATRLSGATGRDTLNRGQLSAGVRFSLVDEQDLRRRGAAGSDTLITRITGSMVKVYVAARERVGPTASLVLNSDEKTALKALSDSIKQYWSDTYWNAKSIEFALAARALAADSLGRNPKMDELAGWLTYADGVSDWGQLLLGAKFGSARDAAGAFNTSNTFAARFYVGSNALKGFVEGQQASGGSTGSQWLVNSGVELRIPSVGWINASAGYTSAPSGEKPRMISSFKFKAGVPGAGL